MVVNGAIDAKGQITWLKDRVNYENYKSTDDAYEPITSEDMSDYARQFNYNKSLKKEGFMDKYGSQVISGFIIIILVMVLSLTWGKFTEPLLNAQENHLIDQQIKVDMLKEIKELKTGQIDLEKEIERQQEEINLIDSETIIEVPPN